MRQLMLLMALLAIPLVHSGCQEAKAATSAPAQTLWTSADVSRVLDDLREIREQKKLLEEVRASVIEQQNTTATLTEAIASLSQQLEGIEQRLDAPAAVSASPITSKPVCVTINGTDHELAQLIADYYVVPWTWLGEQTAAGLAAHLSTHGVSGLEGLTFSQLKKLHAALHEKESSVRKMVSTSAVQQNFQLFGDVQPSFNTLPDEHDFARPDREAAPAPPCPNGQCPVQTAAVRTRTVNVSKSSSYTAPNGAVSFSSPRVTSFRSVSSCSGGKCRLRRR